MPIDTLTFNLPEEECNCRLAHDAEGWYGVAWEMDQWLRERIKYDCRADLQPVRDKLNAIIDGQGVSLDDVD